MQIAITGGNGRVGRAVTDLALAQDHTVVIIDRTLPESEQQGVSAIRADITDYEAIEHAFRGCDAVIHLAAIASPIGNPPHVVHHNNVIGSYNALCAATHLGITHVCQASSINATGAAYSRQPRFDYLPLDERHPTYNEDPYSLSKWICEEQAHSIVRRNEGMTIASLRFHWIVPDRTFALQHGQEHNDWLPKHLWGYTNIEAAARACLLALTAAYKGHEVFQIVAPDTMMTIPSFELAQRFFPNLPIQGDLSGTTGFFDCRKAEQLLGWKHNEESGVRSQESE
ncbi:MAG: NAD(P)-dependent oxidoreductase [Roseiflexaceae bacterium]|nr:NAD(P)-dependent oxidoreductase [Roseiflexaceae bacterium]